MNVYLHKLLPLLGLIRSSSEGRRVVDQGGVRINGVVVSDLAGPIEVNAGDVIMVGTLSKKVTREVLGALAAMGRDAT